MIQEAIATKPTSAQYSEFQTAYDYFNSELFSGKLPQCLITMQRGKKFRGFFFQDRFTHRKDKNTTCEIALNPEHFLQRSDSEILSTLVHEMVHLQQYIFGTPGRRGYHNLQFANWMEDVGLIASDTGLPDGKKTGQSMAHYIKEGGVFERACTSLEAQGFKISWADAPQPAPKKNKTNRSKYVCPGCDTQAWAKPDIALICGNCESELEEEI